jgi:hypothetical protein
MPTKNACLNWHALTGVLMASKDEREKEQGGKRDWN